MPRRLNAPQAPGCRSTAIPTHEYGGVQGPPPQRRKQEVGQMLASGAQPDLSSENDQVLLSTADTAGVDGLDWTKHVMQATQSVKGKTSFETKKAKLSRLHYNKMTAY